jgi:O-methyltransferase
MNTKLFFIRKLKALFLRLNLHILFEPFFNLVLNFAYLTRLSKWRKINTKLPFDDFYNKKVKYEDRFKLHEYVFETEKLEREINYLEFGVADGISFKWWINKNKNINSKFIGFDTFTGLPEDFGVMKKKDFDTKGILPDINDSRAEFRAGLFQHSLPKFIKEFNFDKRTVLHMDADLYSSTLFVLTMLGLKIKKDDIIIFDEFGVPTHEFRAFCDFFDSYMIQYKILGAINNYLQLAIKII